MRELKFRVWDKDNNEFVRLDEETFIAIDDEKVQVITGNENYGDEYENVEVMQYTGLKDKNDKEIYEGDVIQFTWDSDSCWGKAGTYIGFVKFDGGVFEIVYIGKVREKRFRENMECYDNIKSFMDWSQEVQVIGNIYERPELLQQE